MLSTEDGARVVVSIDVGGTLMKGMILTTDLRRLAAARRDTPVQRGPDAVVAEIAQFAADLTAGAVDRGASVIGVGAAVPGWVDEADGMALGATNIGWSTVPLRQILEDRLGVPAQLRHDVRAGAVAELRCGAGRGRDSFVFVPVGTGIGAAIVVNDIPMVGDHYLAGEIGHVPVPGCETRCRCGRIGCLETIASASAIARRYADIVGHPVSGAREVASALASGDTAAQRVWQEAVEALAQVLLMSNTILDIGHYIIGGGLVMSGQTLLEPLASAVSRLPHDGVRPTVSAAELGDDAGCIGAALAILGDIGHQPHGGLRS